MLAIGAAAQTSQPPPLDGIAAWTPVRAWLATHQRRAETIGGVIQTDRPSFTAAHTVVPKGWVQLESGYQFTHDHDGNLLTNSNGAPQFNLRLGLTDWLEWRTLWDGVVSTAQHTAGANLHGFQTSSADLQTGVKIQATQPNGWIPQSALIATVFLPTGYGSLANGRVAPQIDYIYSWQLSEIWSFTGSTGAVWGRAGDRGTDQWFQSLVLGQGWSDKLSTFGEWYVIRNESAQGDSTPQTMDAGVQWRPLANIQFDCARRLRLE